MACALNLSTRVAMGENVADLADGNHRTPRLCRAIEEVADGWRHGEVLAVGRTAKIAGPRAKKGARDYATYIERINEHTHYLAEFIQTFEAEGFFMCGDLQHRIN